MNAELRLQEPQDEAAIDELMVAAFGEARFARTVWNLRYGQAIEKLSFVQLVDGRLIGSLRYWPILLAGQPSLLLGPLAIAPEFKGRGFGKQLVSHSLELAKSYGYHYVIVSGERDYYPQFGFKPASPSEYLWPGFIEQERLQIKFLSTEAARSGSGAKAILPCYP